MSELEICRLVLPHPGELRRREVSGRVQKRFEAAALPDRFERTGTHLDSPAIAPDDRRPDDAAVSVEEHEPMHLIGDADGSDIARGDVRALQ